MEKQKGACSVALCLILAIFSAGAVFAYFYYVKNPVCPTVQPAVCPATQPQACSETTTPAPASPVSCDASDLSASVSFEGAAGTIYGSLSIKNISNEACTIEGNNFPRLNYDENAVKNINVVNQGLPSAKQFVINPGSAVYALIHFPNGPQCNSGINTVNATLSYEIAPNINLNFENVPPQGGQSQPGFSITACAASQDITQVSISNLSDQPTP